MEFDRKGYWEMLINRSVSRFFLLAALHQRAMHGYELAKAISGACRGCCEPSDAMIYPALHDLLEGGYVRVPGGGPGGPPAQGVPPHREGRGGLSRCCRRLAACHPGLAAGGRRCPGPQRAGRVRAGGVCSGEAREEDWLVMAKRDPHQIKKFVRERYGARARERLAGLEARESEPGASAPVCAPRQPAEASCCGPAEPPAEERLVSLFYSAEQIKDLPEEALSSLGCGNPTAIAGLKEGEHVLDLGSGGGLDCFLAAQKVGPKGKAVGLDMTPDMVELARRNAGKVGLSNVEFHQGEIENALPGRLLRRHHLQLRHQPVAGQGRRLPRVLPGAEARRAFPRLGHRLGARSFGEGEERPGELGGLRRRRSDGRRVRGQALRRRLLRCADAPRGRRRRPRLHQRLRRGREARGWCTPPFRGQPAELAGQATEESGVAGLSIADKELVALGAAIGAGCHPCTQYHTQAALKAGLDPVEVRWAIEMAQVVRARGGIAVANVGRRILGVDQQELDEQAAPPCRGSALVWLGAAAGCNSGVLLAEYAAQAAELGVGGAELREAIEIAEMVKTQAGKFLSRDVERALGKCPEPVAARLPRQRVAARRARYAGAAETVAGAATGDSRSWLWLRRRGAVAPAKAGEAWPTQYGKVADIMWAIDELSSWRRSESAS